MMPGLYIIYNIGEVMNRVSCCKALPALRVSLRRAAAAVAVALACAMSPSCTQDNVHLPECGAESGSWTTGTMKFPGMLVTTVPAMEEYLEEPVVSPMAIAVGNVNVLHSGYVTVRTEPFGMHDPFIVSLMGKGIDIGAMEIEGVEYAAYPSGGGCLRKEEFEVQAGAYRTRGTLHGELSRDGVLSLTLQYRPGAMPFDIVSAFDSRSDVPLTQHGCSEHKIQ